MLRITQLHEGDPQTTLCVQGLLLADRASLLEDICDDLLAAGQEVALNLAGVSFADEGSALVLASLRERGVAIEEPTPLVEVMLRSSTLGNEAARPW